MPDFNLRMCKNNEFSLGSDFNFGQREWYTPFMNCLINWANMDNRRYLNSALNWERATRAGSQSDSFGVPILSIAEDSKLQSLLIWLFLFHWQISPHHSPMMLIPCGHNLCEACCRGAVTCYTCDTDIGSHTSNIMLQQIIQSKTSTDNRRVSNTPKGHQTSQRDG